MKPIDPKLLLMIAYSFYPPYIPASLRTSKFAKYLSRSGWRPFVIASTYQSSVDQTIIPIPVDQLLLTRRLPIQFRLSFIKKWFPFSLDELYWSFLAIEHGKSILLQNKFKAIWATTLPPAAHLVALTLKNKTGLPLVVDYRDLWTLNPFTEYKTRFQRSINFKLEQKVLSAADAVVTVTAKMAQELKDNFQIKGKVFVIPNGYDTEDFKNVTLGKQTDDINILYTGSIYGLRKETIIKFVNALAKLERQFPVIAQKMTISFIGAQDKWLQDYIYSTLSMVQTKFSGRIRHEEIINRICEASVLLLLLEMIDCGSVTAKIFEYIASDRPILAVGKSKEVENILKGIENCRMVTGENDTEIIQAILDLSSNSPINQKQREHLKDQYSREKQSMMLNDILEEIT